MHVYISTACRHDLCERCRLACKFCDAECLCLCHHRSKGTAMTTPENPESVDNPATPDVDVDPNPTQPGEPVEPVEQQDDPAAAPQGAADPDSDDAQNDPDDELEPADNAGQGQDFSEPADGVQDDGS